MERLLAEANQVADDADKPDILDAIVSAMLRTVPHWHARQNLVFPGRVEQRHCRRDQGCPGDDVRETQSLHHCNVRRRSMLVWLSVQRITEHRRGFVLLKTLVSAAQP